MSRYRKDLGDFGETVAEKFYLKSGYRVLEKNYTVRGGEIDLIVENRKFLVFVEVKTRRNLQFGYPSEAVNEQKIQHMRCAATRYLSGRPTKKEIRFDVIEVIAMIVEGVPQLIEMNHIPDIL